MSWFEERAGLAGRVAVVTGGAGGLGEAIVEDLVANAVGVAVLDRDPEAAACMRSRTDVLVVTGDARDTADLEAVFSAVDERWGRLDILVNVVGGTFRAPFTDTSPKGWDALLHANLGHVMQACALAIPRMRVGGRGGSIVNLSTIEAHRAAPGFAVYSAAKAGVEQLARSLAVELAPDGIRINNVAPDFVPTPAMGRVSGPDAVPGPEALRVAIPMGRAGRPADVAGCVVFLVSDLAAYVTGTTLHPDGGTGAAAGWFNWPGSGWSNQVPQDALERLTIGDSS